MRSPICYITRKKVSIKLKVKKWSNMKLKSNKNPQKQNIDIQKLNSIHVSDLHSICRSGSDIRVIASSLTKSSLSTVSPWLSTTSPNTSGWMLSCFATKQIKVTCFHPVFWVHLQIQIFNQSYSRTLEWEP